MGRILWNYRRSAHRVPPHLRVLALSDNESHAEKGRGWPGFFTTFATAVSAVKLGVHVIYGTAATAVAHRVFASSRLTLRGCERLLEYLYGGGVGSTAVADGGEFSIPFGRLTVRRIGRCGGYAAGELMECFVWLAR